ncbi:MAG TPA: hypothetical protein VHS03_08610 [Gaiellaceae bacterium]|nr:hypothetical protein [Gaiellaceae bacterium]
MEVRALVISAAVAAAFAFVWRGVLLGVQSPSGLEAAVEQSYRLDYEQGHGAEPKQVRCLLSAFNPDLVTRSQSIGADGPFDDCTATFSDGTHASSCWSAAKHEYRMVWSQAPQAGKTATSDPGCGGLLFRPVVPRWSTPSVTLDLNAP